MILQLCLFQAFSMSTKGMIETTTLKSISKISKKNINSIGESVKKNILKLLKKIWYPELLMITVLWCIIMKMLGLSPGLDLRSSLFGPLINSNADTLGRGNVCQSGTGRKLICCIVIELFCRKWQSYAFYDDNKGSVISVRQLPLSKNF